METVKSFRNLNELFGEGTISESRCSEWFASFKSGDTSLEDKSGRGRLSGFDNQSLLVAVEENENLTTRILAEEFNVDHSIDRLPSKWEAVIEACGYYALK